MLAVSLVVVMGATVVANAAVDYKYKTKLEAVDGKQQTVWVLLETDKDINKLYANGSTLHFRVTQSGEKFKSIPEVNVCSTQYPYQSVYGKEVWVGSIELERDKVGKYDIRPYGTDYNYAKPNSFFEFYVKPGPPVKAKIQTFPDRIIFDKYGAWVYNGIDNLAIHDLGTNTAFVAYKKGNSDRYSTFFDFGGVKVKPSKSYKFDIYGFKGDADEFTWDKAGEADKRTVKTGPNYKPVITSMSTKGYKAKRIWDSKDWRYEYKGSYTVTIKLKKKPPTSAKGIYVELSDGTSRYLSGRKTTYTFTNSFFNSANGLKGRTVSATVFSYGSKTYGAFSYPSKAKSAKIR